MLGPCGQTGDDKSEHGHFRNKGKKWMGIGEFNLDDHSILSTTVGKNPLEEME